MKHVKFKRDYFTNFYSLFLSDDEDEVLRILQNKPSAVDKPMSRENGSTILLTIKKQQQRAYEKWQSYDERDPFHHQIFPMETKAYALQQVTKFISDVDSLLEWLYDEKTLDLLEWYDVYQLKLEQVN